MSDETTEESADSAAAAPPRPVLRVVSGNPSAEELAVLTALAAAAGGEGEPERAVLRGGWRDPARVVRRQLLPGPGAWRSSAW